MKQCTSCHEMKELTEFVRMATTKDGRSPHCKSCKRDRRRKPTISQRLAKKLQSKYDMTIQQYQDLLEKQDGRCAICGVTPLFKRLTVDHCHDTGRVRGLLCGHCNAGIGRLRDDSDLCRMAADYLDSH